jgi:GGDEF domain-containing protein
MERGVPRRRRPRPVAGAGVELVLARGDDLAKGWLLAMVEDAPLEDAAAILSGDVAHDGPRICDALVRAVGDERDLHRIQRDGTLEPLVSRIGELAGARSAEAAAHAVETLKDVVWSALRSELSQDDPDLLADAAERLALATETIRAAVLRRWGEDSTSPPSQLEPLRVAPTDGGAVGDGAFGESGGRRASDRVREELEEGAREPLWIDALREEIIIADRAGCPLSLVLVELDEYERLVAVEPHGEVAATFGRFAQVVRTAVRRRDVLACETDSRAWIIARDTGRAGAQALGTRIAAAVPSAQTWRGAPLTVSVGLAVLGEDGHNAALLIDVAEQARFAAEASGIGIVTGAGKDGTDPPGPTPAS